MNVALSEKDRKFREFALEGSMWTRVLIAHEP